MNKFQEITTFTAVVDAGSFVKAAERLNTSKAAVSRHLFDLETRLGVRLLHRTTRKLSLTEEGEVFYERCKEILAAIESAENEITFHAEDVSGHIRINAPFSFGIRTLAPLWGAFHQKYPKVTLDVELSDRLVDVVEEGYDLAIRIAALTAVAALMASSVACSTSAELKSSWMRSTGAGKILVKTLMCLPGSAVAIAIAVAVAVEVVLGSTHGNLAAVVHQFIANKRCAAAVGNNGCRVVAHWAAVARISRAVTVETVRDSAKKVVVQPPVVRGPHRSAVVHVHVPVTVGLQKAHQVAVDMQIAGHVVRVLHIDSWGGVLNRQIPRHRVAGLCDPARQVNVDRRIASGIRPGTVDRPHKRGGVIAIELVSVGGLGGDTEVGSVMVVRARGKCTRMLAIEQVGIQSSTCTIHSQQLRQDISRRIARGIELGGELRIDAACQIHDEAPVIRVGPDQLVELQLVRAVAQHPDLKVGRREGGAAVARNGRLVVVQNLDQRIGQRSGRRYVGEVLHLVPLCNPGEGAGHARAGTVFEDGGEASRGNCA